MQCLVGYSDAGLARQYIDPDTVQHWLDKVWAEHHIRHRHYLRKVDRDEKKARSFARKGQGLSTHKKTYKARPQEGHHRGTETLQGRCLHMPRVCRPLARLPHETPIKKP
eukprot:239619-Pyramimonas_sp.AAC.2